MDALILSCSTGGGHNAAGTAIKEELEVRGHHVTMMDPYELVSHKLAEEVGNIYVKMVQHSPKLFGFVYSLGGIVRNIPGKSPVYYANIRVAKKLRQYLQKSPADVILMPHLYPAELITYLKKKGVLLPQTIFIATDYVCIPFTEETNCDYYVVPGKAQMADFIRRGIPREKLRPYGIPVSRAFDEEIDPMLAREALGLDPDRYYALLTGGSIGAGDMKKIIRILLRKLKRNKPKGTLIVVCGNNEKLYQHLQKEYMTSKYADKLILIRKTNQMALYMKACDLFLSKPGGLSSTEAAVVKTPYIHMNPIPGCESKNITYFSKTGMSLAVRHPSLELTMALKKLDKPENVQKMRKAQMTNIPQDARSKICDWLEALIERKQKI